MMSTTTSSPSAFLPTSSSALLPALDWIVSNGSSTSTLISSTSSTLQDYTQNGEDGSGFFDNDGFSREEIIFQRRVRNTAMFFLLLAGVIGIPGNLFVVIAILRSNRLKTVSHVLIFNLSLADLFFLLGVPIVVAQIANDDWLFGGAVCKMFLTFNGINQFASSMFLGVLSLDRFMAVCHPITSRPYRSVKVVIFVSMACWLLVTLEMVPVLIFGTLVQVPALGPRLHCMIYWDGVNDKFSSDSDYSDAGLSANGSMVNDSVDYVDIPSFNGSSFGNNNNVSAVEEDYDYELMARQTNDFLENFAISRQLFTLYSFILSYIVPLLAMWFFYSRIIISLWRRRQQFFQGGNRHRNTAKVTMMGLAIVVVYTFCWLPYWTLQWSIISNAAWTMHLRYLFPISYFAYCTQYLNSALNPFLYAILTDTFRDVVRKGLSWIGIKTKLTAGDGRNNNGPVGSRLTTGREESTCYNNNSRANNNNKRNRKRKSSFTPLLEKFSRVYNRTEMTSVSNGGRTTTGRLSAASSPLRPSPLVSSPSNNLPSPSANSLNNQFSPGTSSVGDVSNPGRQKQNAISRSSMPAQLHGTIVNFKQNASHHIFASHDRSSCCSSDYPARTDTVLIPDSSSGHQLDPDLYAYQQRV